jgi:hypothetical protein
LTTTSNQTAIEPHKVTKPIQLLAAWLAGLVLTNGSFLGAAAVLTTSWVSEALVVAAIANVPLFLVAVFVLQTRFRAELQEDVYYAEYLSKKTSLVYRVDKRTEQETRIAVLEKRVHSVESGIIGKPESSVPRLGDDTAPSWEKWRIAINCLLPNYATVRSALSDHGIGIAATFGDRDHKRPEPWTVALSHDLPAANKLALLKLLIPLGIERIALWQPFREADENEDVYVGSYGEIGTPVSKELRHLIETETSMSRIYQALESE